MPNSTIKSINRIESPLTAIPHSVILFAYDFCAYDFSFVQQNLCECALIEVVVFNIIQRPVSEHPKVLTKPNRLTRLSFTVDDCQT